MYIYAHWPPNEYFKAYAFNKADKAACYVFEMLKNYLSIVKAQRPKKTKNKSPLVFPPDIIFENNGLPVLAQEEPIQNKKSDIIETPEYLEVVNYLKSIKTAPTVEEAIKAISLYEKYSTYSACGKSIIHCLTDIKEAK